MESCSKAQKTYDWLANHPKFLKLLTVYKHFQGGKMDSFNSMDPNQQKETSDIPFYLKFLYFLSTILVGIFLNYKNKCKFPALILRVVII